VGAAQPNHYSNGNEKLLETSKEPVHEERKPDTPRRAYVQKLP
jgi:hypothetical protein